jgi:hypothetical protein
MNSFKIVNESQLFDPQYYARRMGLSSKCRGSLVRHYLEVGEPGNVNPGPLFWTSHYRNIVPKNATGQSPLVHYLTDGFRLGLNPTPFFEHEWYAWQNPDYTSVSDNPYFHYITKGITEGRDPSPSVDMIKYRSVVGQPKNDKTHYEMILDGRCAPSMGIYNNWDDLISTQRHFIDSISVFAFKTHLDRLPRRFLVFLQCGPKSKHREWFFDGDRSWDLLVNYYDHSGFDPGIGDYVFFQPGTKFTAIYKIWTEYRDVLEKYEQILFLDDDIMVRMPDIDRLFQLCVDHNLDLAQMALSSDSHGVWKIFFHQSGPQIRYVTGVEVMMPVISHSAMQKTGNLFRLSVSGYGLDFLLARRISKSNRKNIAVINEVVATHSNAIDQTSGDYYAYLRAHHINSKAELWHLIKRLKLPRTFETVC